MDFFAEVAAWFTDPAQWQGRSSIPVRVRQHLWMSLLPMVVALVVALPFGIVLGHVRRGGAVAINLSNVGRAIPSFALLVIGAQIFGLEEVAGVPVSAALALVALAIPPLVTNAWVGMAEVGDDIRDAAVGMGMRGHQVLARVELPLAMPLLMAGVRTSTVQVVATATLAALVGAGGLGRYIVDGIATRDFVEVFSGAILVAALALVVEGVLAVAQRYAVPAGIRPPRRRRRPPAVADELPDLAEPLGPPGVLAEPPADPVAETPAGSRP